MPLHVGCHQRAWPGFQVGLPASNDLIKTRIPHRWAQMLGSELTPDAVKLTTSISNHRASHLTPTVLMFHGGAQALFSIDTADGSQTPKILCLPQTGPMRQQGCWSYHTPLTECAINLRFLQCGPSHLSPCPENMPSIFSPLSGSM